VPGEVLWLHPEAIKEARAAREWYLTRNVEAAQAFMTELDAAVEHIERGARQCPPYLTGTRRYLFHRFPFFVVFRETTTRIEIIAIAHGRRRPGYWLGR
jgi:plasmid stabilization system protein ParE